MHRGPAGGARCGHRSRQAIAHRPDGRTGVPSGRPARFRACRARGRSPRRRARHACGKYPSGKRRLPSARRAAAHLRAYAAIRDDENVCVPASCGVRARN
ncbi:Protamine P1 [Burkholderia pseudomallei 1710b]|uniref:Protamine P1 n=1 Tax=Burkholderia pseudomallei (strain 1710b) TaxID=320372 RepID=Q3JJX5_BURP1|nr:Protamine P1 [Burkholderia pseudomallei 1710b]